MLLFKTKRLERLEREVVMLENLFAQALQRIDKLEQARWGLKVDGTPKSKPGRKVKDERIS
jgi:uncharacterized protein involved in exopolysaccharide biosynthesis